MVNPTSYNKQKLTKWITDLNTGNKTIKFLEKYTGINFHDLDTRSISTNNSKTDKLDFIKIKTFVLERTLLRKWNNNPQNGIKYLQIIYLLKDL